jgi:uncharacterized membrane protein
MAINKNLYEFIGISELSSRAELKTRYRAFLRKGRNENDPAEYTLKKAAWLYLLDPKKKAEMDEAIEQCTTSDRLAERNEELRRRKIAMILSAAAFICAFIPIIFAVMYNDASYVGATFLMLIPMILIFYFSPLSATDEVKFSVAPYLVGILVWAVWIYVAKVPLNAIGIVGILLFWAGDFLRSKRRGDNTWTML